MKTYPFVTVDVFTSTRFGGNPLAVFPDASGLSDGDMQALAKEFNLSETTFVLPPADPAHTAQVRIFTPSYEMPFAGHPNVARLLNNNPDLMNLRLLQAISASQRGQMTVVLGQNAPAGGSDAGQPQQ